MARWWGILLALLLPLAAQIPAQAQDRSPERLLVLGDSIMAWNRSNGNSIPQLLGRLPDYEVTNRATPGAAFSHSSNLRSMLQREIRGQLPKGSWDVILLNGGANDFFRECNCNRCAATLERMVSADGARGEVPAFLDLLRSRARRVVWMDYYPGSVRGGPYGACVDELASYQRRLSRAAARRPWVSFVDAGDVYDPRDLSLYARDLVHPTPKGSAAIATLIARTLARSR